MRLKKNELKFQIKRHKKYWQFGRFGSNDQGFFLIDCFVKDTLNIKRIKRALQKDWVW